MLMRFQRTSRSSSAQRGATPWSEKKSNRLGANSATDQKTPAPKAIRITPSGRRSSRPSQNREVRLFRPPPSPLPSPPLGATGFSRGEGAPVTELETMVVPDHLLVPAVRLLLVEELHAVFFAVELEGLELGPAARRIGVPLAADEAPEL